MDKETLKFAEWVYAENPQIGFGNPEMEREMIEKGLVAAIENTQADGSVIRQLALTPKGREVLNDDPRTLHLDIRDAILSAARDEDQRSNWLSYLSSIHSLSSPLELHYALREELEFCEGRADNEPYEIALKGNGRSSSGALIQGQNIMLLCPQWFEAEDVEDAQAFIKTIVDKRDDLIHLVKDLDARNTPATPGAVL